MIVNELSISQHDTPQKHEVVVKVSLIPIRLLQKPNHPHATDPRCIPAGSMCGTQRRSDGRG